MKNIVITISFLLITAICQCQFFGYCGKKFEVSTQLSIMPSRGYINASKFGINRNSPKNAQLPVNINFGFNYAVSRTSGIGLTFWYAPNFVGYRTPWSDRSGYEYKYNEGQIDLSDSKLFNFDRNYKIRTLFTGFIYRRYSNGFLAPAGNYLELGFGFVNVLYSPDNIYKYQTKDCYFSENDAIPDSITSLKLHEMKQPKFKPIPVLTFGYCYRNKFPNSNKILYEIGLNSTFGIFKPKSVERINKMGNDYSVIVGEKEDLENLIIGSSYVYIIKRNSLKINLGIIYLF
ncbi:MAG: hypothetical protein A2W91_12705 [Bacteroidetes bacterium GWF2_38_335]|nr:MAG: hypothetical protein A2W91_12705 [Bacteroidetes bacterium GWF2_38_335]OFY77027.1 MAG: hypothetical protein A2281_00820 [Bacteroidetes bacterium RIFOXYA12_FULL_38_20]HBS86885.1 hypothetical protein [Bacteroidales bacterium]